MGSDPEITRSDVDELVGRMGDAADAYISGDHRRYFALFDHGDDYSLMPPTGGATRHGFGLTEEDIARGSTFFASGEARLDVEQSYVSGDLVVLVAVERQHGVVGGLPDQDLSLRITMVFRRAGDRWQVVHRHADALVREIPFDHFARLARGDVEG
jgi:ketosteroid isomerase-like protein